MKINALIPLTVALLVVLTVFATMMYVFLSQKEPPTSPSPPAPKEKHVGECCEGLMKFGSHRELLDYLSKYLSNVNAIQRRAETPIYVYPIGAFETRAPGAETRYSKTNVQVEGVDEPDIVKTNGYLMVVAGGALRNTVWVIDTAEDKVASTIFIDNKYVVKELFLSNNTLVVLATNLILVPRSPGWFDEPWVELEEESTAVFVYDLIEPSEPKLLFNVSFTGRYITSRLHGSNVYVLSQIQIYRPLIPKVNSEDVSIDRIFLLTETPGFYVVLTTVNLEKMEHRVYAYILSEVNWIYMSHSRLYLGSSTYILHPYLMHRELCIHAKNHLPGEIAVAVEKYVEEGELWKAVESISNYLSNLNDKDREEFIKALNQTLWSKIYFDKTSFYVLNVKGDEVDYSGSFTLDGVLLDQFSMEEFKERYFIVATTSRSYRILPAPYRRDIIIQPYPLPTVPREGTEVLVYPYPVMIDEENNVYVVNLNKMAVASELRGLASGERIYSARLIGEVFYLVTFRTVDPLFAINVSNPEELEVIGLLKTPGFSEYLHPLGIGILLGVGLENNSLKISILNVSDPRNMREVSKLLIPYAYSEVLQNHRAFTIDDERERFYIPVVVNRWIEVKGDAGEIVVAGLGIAVFSYRNYELKLIKILEGPGSMDTLRAVYVDEKLYVVSNVRIGVYDINTLEFLKEIELPPTMENTTFTITRSP